MLSVIIKNNWFTLPFVYDIQRANADDDGDEMMRRRREKAKREMRLIKISIIFPRITQLWEFLSCIPWQHYSLSTQSSFTSSACSSASTSIHFNSTHELLLMIQLLIVETQWNITLNASLYFHDGFNIQFNSDIVRWCFIIVYMSVVVFGKSLFFFLFTVSEAISIPMFGLAFGWRRRRVS